MAGNNFIEKSFNKAEVAKRIRSTIQEIIRSVNADLGVNAGATIQFGVDADIEKQLNAVIKDLQNALKAIDTAFSKSSNGITEVLDKALKDTGLSLEQATKHMINFFKIAQTSENFGGLERLNNKLLEIKDTTLNVSEAISSLFISGKGNQENYFENIQNKMKLTIEKIQNEIKHLDPNGDMTSKLRNVLNVDSTIKGNDRLKAFNNINSLFGSSKELQSFIKEFQTLRSTMSLFSSKDNNLLDIENFDRINTIVNQLNKVTATLRQQKTNLSDNTKQATTSIINNSQKEQVELKETSLTYDQLIEKVKEYITYSDKLRKNSNGIIDYELLSDARADLNSTLFLNSGLVDKNELTTLSQMENIITELIDSSHNLNTIDLSLVGQKLANVYGIALPQAAKQAEQQIISGQNQIQTEVQFTTLSIKEQQEIIARFNKVLDDSNYKTSGKREATNQLKSATIDYTNYINNPSNYNQYEHYGEQAGIAWVKAYKEAVKQGVALSVLDKYHTNAESTYNNNLNILQKELEARTRLLSEQESLLNTNSNVSSTNQTIEETKAIEANTKAKQENKLVSQNNVQIIPSLSPSKDTLELQSLELLKQKVFEVEQAVLLKNSAFETEKLIVKEAADGECFNLDRIIEKVKVLQTAINSLDFSKLNTSFQGNTQSDILNLQNSLQQLSNLLHSLNSSELTQLGKFELDTKSLNKIKLSTQTIQNVKDLSEALLNLSAAIELINQNKIAVDILAGLKISSTTVKNVETLAYAVDLLKTSLNFTQETTTALNTIKELANQSEKLKSVSNTISNATPAKTKPQNNTSLLSDNYKIDTSANITQLENTSGKISTYNQKLTELQDKYQKLIDYAATFNSTNQSAINKAKENIEVQKKEISKLITDLKSDKWNTISKYGTSIGNFTDIESAKNKINELIASYKNFGKVQENTLSNGMKQFVVQVESANKKLHTLKYTYDTTTNEMYQNVAKTTHATGTLEKVTGQLGNKWKEVAKYIFSYGSFYRIWAEIKQGINVVKELDTGFTNLQKVSNDTATALNNFRNQSFHIAAEIGSTGKTVREAASEWARLGYNIKEVEKLSTASTVYVNVGDGIDAATATKDLVSSMKAFKIDADAAMDIVDKLNEVGNNYAVSSTELGEILEKSSSALAISGDSIDQVIAMGAAMNEVLQDAATTGTTLKMLGLRIRGASVEIEQMGESTDGMTESTSKLREKILALTNVNGLGGFDIMYDEETFKPLYEQIKGISEIWDRMSQIDQSALLELIAGKNRAQGAAALIENFGQAENALQDSINSSGSAMAENEKFLESIAGHLQLLTNQWQKFWEVSLNRDTINFFVDLSKSILETTTELGGLKTILPLITASLISIKSIGK